jgi:acetyl esterase/lipase
MTRLAPVTAAVFLVTSSAAPAAQQKGPRPVPPPGVSVTADRVYADRPTGPLRLDLYRPAEKPAGPLPVVVWVHGGGWANGSKDRCPAAWLAANGYAVASVEYRLTGVARWPAQIDDLRDAVRWLRSHAKEHGLDPARVGAWGGSAGGHLAALLGTLDAPKDETVSSRVQAVCDWYGPADLLTMPANVPGPNKTDAALAATNGAKLLGGAVKDRPDLARAASPLHQVSKDDPPFLILHGDADPQVPLAQSERLAARLKEAEVPVALHVLPGAGHGGKAFDTPEARKWVAGFFDRHLKGR